MPPTPGSATFANRFAEPPIALQEDVTSRSLRRRSANRVETEGTHGEDGRRKAEAESNVVRLPCDWLGPREELVPFGVRAQAPERITPTDDLEPDLLARAADFWGEGSAAV